MAVAGGVTRRGVLACLAPGRPPTCPPRTGPQEPVYGVHARARGEGCTFTGTHRLGGQKGCGGTRGGGLWPEHLARSASLRSVASCRPGHPQHPPLPSRYFLPGGDPQVGSQLQRRPGKRCVQAWHLAWEFRREGLATISRGVDGCARVMGTRPAHLRTQEAPPGGLCPPRRSPQHSAFHRGGAAGPSRYQVSLEGTPSEKWGGGGSQPQDRQV